MRDKSLSIKQKHCCSGPELYLVLSMDYCFAHNAPFFFMNIFNWQQQQHKPMDFAHFGLQIAQRQEHKSISFMILTHILFSWPAGSI